jgi:pheromone alpha factor receptor
MSASPTQPVLGPWTITYSNAGISQSNSSFYYDEQVVHWLANFGLPLVNVTLSSIDTDVWYNTACTINFAAQAGGCGVMFFVVLVLSQASKRRTPIFILNVLSLLLGFLRGLFFALYFISAWVKLYPYFSNDYSAIPTRAYVISIIGSVVPLLMTITVNLSLVLQAYTVTKNMRDLYRYSIIAMSGLVFFLAVGFKFADVVINCIAIVQAKYYAEQWVQHGALYMETISIWYFSIIFTSKLVYTLYYRKKHGWKQWSGVKILAAMGGCTMVIPCEYSSQHYLGKVLTRNSTLRYPRICQRCGGRLFPGSWNSDVDNGCSLASSLFTMG